MTGHAWQVGVAMARFPVPPGVPLGGYLARSGDAVGTHDPLEVGALTLVADADRLVILTADVVAFDRLLIEHIQSQTGLADGQLLACASHTHSGPAGIVRPLHPAWPATHDEEMRARFATIAAGCISASAARLTAVDLTIACAEPDEPVWRNRNDSDGPVDQRITVLAARRPTGEIVAVLLHFACHPTVLGHENLRVSADLAGTARRALAAELGEADLPVLFANGAAGDISTRYTRTKSDFPACRFLGGIVGKTAQTALIGATSSPPIAASLRHARATTHLDRATIGPAAPAAPDLKDARVEKAGQQGVELHRRGLGMPWPETIPLDAWILGETVALVAVPGELTAAPGWQIEHSSPFPITRVIGYANGYVGYLPDLPLYRAGTYEALASPYAPGCGEQVARDAAALLTSLHR